MNKKKCSACDVLYEIEVHYDADQVKTFTVIGLDNAKHCARMCKDAYNCSQVDCMNMLTGEVVYFFDWGKVKIG